MANAPTAALTGTRVLVAGASGFVGRQVVRTLLDRGASVGVLVRDVRRLPAAQVARAARVFAVDCAQPGALSAVLAEWPPDVVFQLAAHGVAKEERDARLMQRLNGDLLDEAIEGLGRAPARDWPGLRLVHVGSALEYGELEGPCDEGASARPTTPYGRTKLAGTQAVQRAVRAAQLPALVARLFTVFGPGERSGRLFPSLLAARDQDGPVPLSSGEQRRDFALVWDVADALVDLASLPRAEVLAGAPPFEHGVINLASGRWHTVRAFVTAAAQTLGIAPARLAFGALPQLAEEMPHQAVPVQRLQRALGRTLPGDLHGLMARVGAWLAHGRPEAPASTSADHE